MNTFTQQNKIIKTQEAKEQSQPPQPRIFSIKKGKFLGLSNTKKRSLECVEKSEEVNDSKGSIDVSFEPKQSASFYDYCQQQILKLAGDNKTMQKQLDKIQQSIEKQQRNKAIMERQIKSEADNLQSLKFEENQAGQQIKNLKQKIQQLKKQMTQTSLHHQPPKETWQQFLNEYQQKQNRNEQLRQQISQIKKKNSERSILEEQNTKKMNRIAQLMGQLDKLKEDLPTKIHSSIISHLWAVKKIQYSNLDRILRCLEP